MRWGTAAIVAAAAVGTGAAALLIGRRVSERAVRPGLGGAFAGAGSAGGPGIRVQELAADRVVLTRSVETERPGRYALEWAEGGHAVVGDVLSTGPQSVTRRLLATGAGSLYSGTEVRVTARVHLGDPASALGLDFTPTDVDGELGPMPAWYLPGIRGLWAILVHGPGADRQQALPVLPVLHALRMPVLVVTHRGDEGAPPSPDGLGHFGETEWRDVDAAVRLAQANGAGRIVLYGWSLGATMALHTAARSAWRDSIAGLVLDSPVLDWPATVRREAARAGVPAPLAELGALAAEGRTKVDLAGFARLADGTDLNVPALLLHSPVDAVAPFAAAERLARRRDDLVSLHPVPDGAHAALWNADPDGYGEALRRWLTPLL
ncbi:alpha/beta hydrolase family protein [Kitasatospora sp. DSM 101779]|uniref:alpha/beta hydrolase family protein n=1 Tax=Kitasatospora sp. DSM 101779 TaxID=2853165 RepID=UPI0021DB3FD5|nr:alpha/beta fold hydrolase [Kitasatospora sp. DSM 101779]MCU7822324.1 alpha/beta fold hydrolase [Kitasatospora sp. DSM 101779]